MSNLREMRTDVVGSLLRPEKLKQARIGCDEGKIPSEELRAVEDEAIKGAVSLQEKAGLQVVTDGEFRRVNFQDSFGSCVEGYAAEPITLKGMLNLAEGGTPLQRWEVNREGETGMPMFHRRPVKSRLKLTRNLPLEEYHYVSRIARVPAKVTLIGPDRISQRFDYENSKDVYAGMEEFLADVVAIESEMIRGLVGAGCGYVQVDAPGYTAYVDAPSLDAMRKRGEDPIANLARSIRADNELLQSFGGAVSGIHLCRGNQRSMWHREGSYDAIAEQLFSELGHDRLLLEYDSPRAGSFEALRFVPKGKIVVLGLVSTKVPELETVDQLRRRVDEAATYLPLEQLAISPQCGFSSDVAGNLVSEDDQKRKLEVVVEAARQIWG